MIKLFECFQRGALGDSAPSSAESAVVDCQEKMKR